MIAQSDERQELFDASRASLSKKPISPPFYVKGSQLLSKMVQTGGDNETIFYWIGIILRVNVYMRN